MVVAGLLIGNQGRAFAMSDETRDRLDTFWEIVDELLNAVLFVLIGLEIVVLTFSGSVLLASVILIVVVLVTRFVTVGIPISIMRERFYFEFTPHTIKILTWAGVRGGISVALALSLPLGGERDVILARHLCHRVVLYFGARANHRTSSQSDPGGAPAGIVMSQYSLLKQRRFGPFFATQFLGAFNDNLFKNALVVLITFGIVNGSGADTDTLVNLAAGLFILPFFLFLAMAGQLADKYEKSMLMRRIKLAEIGIMIIAAVGFLYGGTGFLIFLLFLMGTQSTFFGPVKYAILPQHLKEEELVGGNGLVEDGNVSRHPARDLARAGRASDG